jgi:hypothetical protein
LVGGGVSSKLRTGEPHTLTQQENTLLLPESRTR